MSTSAKSFPKIMGELTQMKEELLRMHFVYAPVINLIIRMHQIYITYRKSKL